MGAPDTRSRFSADIDTDKLAEAALAILSLTLHDNGRVWKSLDWDLMNLLEEKGWLVEARSREFLRAHFARAKA
jgi:hypothetical protein